MKHILAITLAATLALPVSAQDTDPTPPRTFLDDYMENLMRDLLDDIQPDIERLMTEMLPRLQELAELVGGLQHYEMPEILPNGDILIRRKSDAPPFEGLPEPKAPIDL